MGSLGTAAGVIGGLVPPAAPIAIPIAAGLLLAAWMYGVYQRSRNVLRCMIAYIVDMTVILQSLFWLIQVQGGKYPDVTPAMLEEAITAFSTADVKADIHREIRLFVERTNFSDRMNRDVTLDKIIELLGKYRFDPKVHVANAAKSSPAAA